MGNETLSRDESIDVFALMRGLSNEERKKTPLEEMQDSKQLGIPVTREEIINGQDDRKRSYVDNDRRNEDFNKEMSDMDENIEKLKYIGAIKKPKNPVQMAELMGRLDSLDLETLKKEAGEKGITPLETTTKQTTNQESVNSNSESVDKPEPVNDPTNNERDSRIDVLIDKTGFGRDVVFTEEERAKLSSAEEIRVIEVEEVSLASAKTKKATKVNNKG